MVYTDASVSLRALSLPIGVESNLLAMARDQNGRCQGSGGYVRRA
jgi:hypothetical protein